MKVLVDNCVDWRVKRLLQSNDVSHVRDLHWQSFSNGRLIDAAYRAGFEVLLTVDKKIKFEHNLDQLPITILEIDLPDSRLPSITAIAPRIEEALKLSPQFRFISIDQAGRVTTLARRA